MARLLTKIISQNYPYNYFPQMFAQSTDFTDNGAHHGMQRMNAGKSYIDDLLRRAPSIIHSVLLPCIKAHLAEGFLEELRSNPSEYVWRLTAPIKAVVTALGTFSLDLSLILDSYHLHQDAWMGTVAYEAVVPVLGLKGNIPSTQISKTLVLAPFSSEEKTAMFGRRLDQSLISVRALNQSKYKLCSSGNYSGSGGSTYEIATEVSQIITALRLFKMGSVGVSALFIDKNRCGLGTESRSLTELRISEYSQSSFELDTSEIPGVNRIYELIESARRHGTLKEFDVTLRRFNQAYSELNREDQILDETIALETCLLRGIQAN